MYQDLDQVLLLIVAILGGGFSLIFLLAWLEPPRSVSATQVAVQVQARVQERRSLRVRLAGLISAMSDAGTPAADLPARSNGLPVGVRDSADLPAAVEPATA